VNKSVHKLFGNIDLRTNQYKVKYYIKSIITERNTY